MRVSRSINAQGLEIYRYMAVVPKLFLPMLRLITYETLITPYVVIYKSYDISLMILETEVNSVPSKKLKTPIPWFKQACKGHSIHKNE